MAAKELIEYVARSLVDDPDAVSVEVVQDPEGTVLELHVAEDDMGKVIGKNGSVAKASYERDLAPFGDVLGAVAWASLAEEPMRVRFALTLR